MINLSTDKRAVFKEVARVLKPGGRVGVSDIVASESLDAGQRAEKGSYVGCIAGALTFSEYQEGLLGAWFTAIEVRPSHEVADGMFSAIVKAVKPA